MALGSKFLEVNISKVSNFWGIQHFLGFNIFVGLKLLEVNIFGGSTFLRVKMFESSKYFWGVNNM